MKTGLAKTGQVAAAVAAASAMLFGGFVGTVSALEQDQAEVRILHNSPDAPAVDIFVNGTRAIEGLAFGESTDLIALPAGTISAAVVPAGGELADAVISADLMLEPCMSYEVAAVGDLANIGAQVYPIDTAAITDGKARVRAVHNSPDAPAVDIAVAGGPVLFSGLAFPNASDFAEVAAGTYDLEIRPAGTMDVALAIPGVTLEPGMIYNVYAVGSLGDGSLTVKPVTASPEPCGAAVGGGDATMTQMPAAGVGDMSSTTFALWAVMAALGLAAVGTVAMRRRAA